MSRINGSLLERTHQAMLAAFSRREDLRQFVSLQLDEHFDALVRDDNLRVQAYELLLWAGRNGREVELLDKLAAERPRETTFAAVAAALHSGAALLPPEALTARLPGGGAVPLQKPLRVQHFTGRDLELARLLADLQPGQALTLCGPGGMGKTALAAEAVWRLAPGDGPPDRFPDGVIFHTFYHQPQADVALESIARAYGVDPRPSPREAARLALANRKALLILDGAEAADDLDAVLAVAGSCGVLITTRRHGDAPAEYQDIAPLPDPESLRLLRAWAGTYAGEGDAPGGSAADEIVRLLGGLPLALFLVGRYLAQKRQRAVEYLPWLAAQGLEALHFGERRSKSIPLLLQRSLEQVSEGARAAFGVAGVLALAPFEAEPVAAALEITVPVAHRMLGELVDYGLLLRPDQSYQVTHALAHGYARSQAVPGGETIRRLALYYAGLAEDEFPQGLAGFAVLDLQRSHILAVQAAALEAKQWDAVREIAWEVESYFYLNAYWIGRRKVVQAGLDAARAAGDPYDEMMFLKNLGLAYMDIGEPRRAIDLWESALIIAHELGDRHLKGVLLSNLGFGYSALGETLRAIELYEQALMIHREIGDRSGEAIDSWNLGLTYEKEGDLARAITLMQVCVAYEQKLGLPNAVADAQRVADLKRRAGV